MKIVQMISEHKNTKRNSNGGFKSKIGMAEYIVEIDGKKVTKHLPIKK